MHAGCDSESRKRRTIGGKPTIKRSFLNGLEITCCFGGAFALDFLEIKPTARNSENRLLHELRGLLPRPCICLQQTAQRRIQLRSMCLHDCGHGLPDRGETKFAIEKGGDGYFVGRIEDRGQSSAHFPSPAGEAQRREISHSRRFKLEGGRYESGFSLS